MFFCFFFTTREIQHTPPPHPVRERTHTQQLNRKLKSKSKRQAKPKSKKSKNSSEANVTPGRLTSRLREVCLELLDCHAHRVHEESCEIVGLEGSVAHCVLQSLLEGADRTRENDRFWDHVPNRH